MKYEFYQLHIKVIKLFFYYDLFIFFIFTKFPLDSRSPPFWILTHRDEAAIEEIKMARGGTQLFIGRLSKETTQRDLENVFYLYGKLSRCDIKYGKYSRSFSNFMNVIFEQFFFRLSRRSKRRVPLARLFSLKDPSNIALELCFLELLSSALNQLSSFLCQRSKIIWKFGDFRFFDSMHGKWKIWCICQQFSRS